MTVSFKSKRYRDKLRTEIKALEALLPVDRTALSRKLDSQTVFRLVISYFRSKIFFQAAGFYQTDDAKQEVKEREDADDKKGPASDGQHGIQLLDGFLLVITSDGTVLYVSENILQYLGFNQVDLMHRCVYGVIHPGDHQEVKVVLEHTLGPIQLQTTTAESSDKEGEVPEKPDTCKPVSFLCRMKCFNGTSAGYLKMLCSGKVEHLSQLSKSNRTSCQILFLFCHPFMINTTEVDQELKQNVFWSKHDLDLSIREIDKKALPVTGYTSPEMEGRSFYSLIHPEDIATCAACHRQLTDSSDVQTMYFRLQNKHGGWVWLQSRGKVISKNSKKFSIVFSHCPVREEDSTYIQQESVLRQRYAINDLMCISQIPEYGSVWKDGPNIMEPSMKRMCFQTHPGTQDEALVAVHSLSGAPCPSSWHALSDRHSPILPSSHVAHKISQREKQLQYQEFKRRQQTQMDQTAFKMMTEWEDQGYDCAQEIPAQTMNEFRGQNLYPCSADNGHDSTWNTPDDLPQKQGFQFGRFQANDASFQRSMLQSFSAQGYNCPPFQMMQGLSMSGYYPHPPYVHNMPPSPPPSPQHNHYNVDVYPRRTPPPPPRLQYQHSLLRDQGDSNRTFNTANYSCFQQNYVAAPCIQDLQRTAEKYLGYCEYEQGTRSLQRQHVPRESVGNCRPQNSRSNQRPMGPYESAFSLQGSMKPSPSSSQSCAYAARCRVQNNERSQSQAQVENHMMIVEHGQPVHARGYMDLPSIGSFLEYLNEV
ncbi:circadian locomoter output cycles protein kaput-like [Haliotis rubra]|uniref:circadian locomoter output cycles protein kaput-like n=1 Tax=Haliotis rubra TaxID=36100 RepID=UPI001EE5BA53|nr:circadian locomoter output cycles protein kaput-like [Haliotis rubra]